MTGRRLAAALAAALALIAPSAEAAERLAWITPGRARVITWGEPAPSAGRELDPGEPADLGPDDLLVLPADPGDRFEIRGDLAAVGLGTGIGDAPDVITWIPLPKAAAGRREVGVPPWSSARFLVLRPARPSPGALAAPLAARVAARESAAMAWYRLDEDVAEWMLGDGPAPRALTAPMDEIGTGLAEARPLLRWLAAAREALAPGARPGETLGLWLVARYLDASLLHRPLVEPYFVRRSVEVQGGAGDAPLESAEHATPWRLGAARPGQAGSGAASRIRLTTAADVIRLGLRARASGPARVIVRAGGAVVREIAWRTSPRLMDAERWSEPRWIRAALPTGDRAITVEVLQGEVAVAAIGHRQRVGVADFFEARRDRVEIVDRATRSSARLGAALAAAEQAPSPNAARSALAAAAQGSPAVRLLVSAEAARWAASPAEARERVTAAFRGATEVNDAIAAPILRAALERLAAAHADPPLPEGVAGAAQPPWVGWAATLGIRPGVDPDDAAAITALSGALVAPEDGRRPTAGGPADRYAAAHGDIPGAAARARQAWAREGRWDALDAAPGVSMWSSVEVPRDAIPDPVAPDPPSCAAVGPHGLRWTVLDAPRSVIQVDAPPGQHARVLLRGAGVDPEVESIVRIDSIPVSVHAGAGVASVVAVAPGERTFEPAKGASPVLARIPRAGHAPCASLRDITQWAWVEGDAAFLVPDRERSTVARIIVAPSVVRSAAQPGAPALSRPARLQISTGGGDYEAWVRPGATGAAEVPIPAGAVMLRVSSDQGVLVRASARLHPALPPPQRTAVPRGGGPSAPVELLLQTIREATRALRRAEGAERDALKERRAAALDLLGFPALAALDRAPPLEVHDFDLETAPSASFALPPGSPPVVPLGLLSRLDPLPLPEDLGPLRTARGARRAGEPRRALTALRPSAEQGAGADALLLALLAEREGEARLGSEAFLRIGLDRKDGRALARAANLATDVAAATEDRLSTLRAFGIAELAARASAARAAAGDPWPDPAPAALARLAPVIAWRAPPRADRTAGSASLDVRSRPEPEQPLPARVRRALVGAPEGALLMTEGSYAQFRLDRPAPVRLSFDGSCRLLNAAETPCALELRVDDEQVSCVSSDPADGPGAIRCSAEIPAGRHRVEVRPPLDTPLLAWVRAMPAGSAQPYPGRVMSTWNDIDPERPLELAFAGPTVVKIRARPAYQCLEARPEAPGEDPTCRPAITQAATSGALRLSISSLDENGEPGRALEEAELALDTTEDPAARRAGVNRPPFFWLGNEVERRLVVLDEGPHVLRVASPAGRALVRVEIAVATGVPRPRNPPPEPPPLPEASAGSRLRWAPPVGDDPDDGALLLAGYVRTVDGNMTDEDLRAGIRFYEIGVDANREVVPERLWAGATAFTRLRTGTSSLGAEVRLDLARDGWIPSLYAMGRLVAQPPALGGRASLTAEWAIPFEEVTLLPWASAAVLAIDEQLAGRADADRDVYTLYSSERRTQGSLGARLRLRPAVDTIVSVGPSLRLAPLFSTLDRAELRADLDVLPGRGLWPWFQLGWVGSYRPSSELREEAFVRNTFSFGMMFWSWFARGHRISLAGETALLVDSPATQIESPRLGFALMLRYDWTGSRGLRDLPPRVTPFRDRLEEDSGAVYREAPATEPRWDDEE